MVLKSAFIFLLALSCITARIHKLQITSDVRRFIALSTFGFYKGGLLQVRLNNFTANPEHDDSVFGFSLDRTLNDAMNPYLDSHTDDCILQKQFENNSVDKTIVNHDAAVIYFILDLKNKAMKVNCTKDLQTIHIYKTVDNVPAFRAKRNSLLHHVSDASLFAQRLKRQSVAEQNIHAENVSKSDPKTKDTQGKAKDMLGGSSCSQTILPITHTVKDNKNYYSTEFVMYVASPAEEGLYNLYFHSCPNYEEDKHVSLDFNIEIQENNGGNYLSAGEMPLPALYFMMALLFFLSGNFWVFILRKSKHPVFKIHYLMAVLIYLKSLSLMFHSINYHYIETKGEHVAAWAILYYVAHLLKGAVLFITIVLIGTGWTFIKHILADKDKKIFVIVIPLQVLANIAEIIIEESEEGDIEHKTWRDVLMLVDLLCCGAILFPVVWSIRHLQEASQTDGKAAINLRKLKLFRHFYIMIVCYIYFTRIIVCLLKITVPFQYEWLDEMFREMATYVFFVLTGYKFRPASANPYFAVSDDDDEMDAVLTESGVTEGLSKVTSRIAPSKTIIEATEEEKDSLLSKRESSHEYD